ncbi:hypothetical protein LINPERPRIM_LOCUS35242 [Linum perenne]
MFANDTSWFLQV